MAGELLFESNRHVFFLICLFFFFFFFCFPKQKRRVVTHNIAEDHMMGEEDLI